MVSLSPWAVNVASHCVWLPLLTQSGSTTLPNMADPPVREIVYGNWPESPVGSVTFVTVTVPQFEIGGNGARMASL